MPELAYCSTEQDGLDAYDLRRIARLEARYESPVKRRVRVTNASIYREVTHLWSIPETRQYWTLCCRQSASPNSEINQNVRIGLHGHRQYHGVDRDRILIELNRRDHPDAHFYADEWLRAIETCESFRPGLVYLDTTSMLNHRGALRLVANTMPLCPPGTVLLANLMINNPHSSERSCDLGSIVTLVSKALPASEVDMWAPDVRSYSYDHGHTEMATFVFLKKGRYV